MGKGFGAFYFITNNLCLTDLNQEKRSLWKLPKWFFPFDEEKVPLTYHGDPKRWKKVNDGVLLTTVGRAQEFILDTQQYPEAIAWIKKLLLND